MPVVRQVIRHILEHVDAEAADSDASQVDGVDRRAQLVRDAVRGLVADDRDITLRNLLQAIYDAIPSRTGRDSFRRAMVNMRNAGTTRPQLAIQAWVGKAKESRGG